MIRNLLVVLITAGAMILSSCTSQKKVEDLTKATREALELVKQEAQRAIRLTEQKVVNNEVDPEIGKQVISNLQVAEKKVDTQLVAVANVQKTGSRDDILKFAEKSNLIIQIALTDLKSLNDLYDVGTFT